MLPRKVQQKLSFMLMMLVISACKESLWNNPHQENTSKNIIFSSFSAAPKTLDPAQAYSSDSYSFICQIYEPPLQYHYLKRPYELMPLAAKEMPKITYLDNQGKQISRNDSKNIAYTVYDIYIKPKQFFQPHPAFAVNEKGSFLYHKLTKAEVTRYGSLESFTKTGAREVKAADFVYEIKRLASPELNSPILSMMQEHITGLTEYTNQLAESSKQHGKINLNEFDISGVKTIDDYHYSITIKGQYPQFIYWLAMPFFAPLPWEADKFYSQDGMKNKNITLAWHPVGSGPFMLSKNDPNSLMVLSKNPNFHGEKYPSDIEYNEENKKFLKLAGKDLPLVDAYNFNLEKENTPYWYKFLQGYYDSSTISSDNFDQSIQISPQGEMELTDQIKQQEIKLETSIDPSIFYLGFNMNDAIVGGSTKQNRLLRQAISIAIDYEEFINIFLNGRGIIAQSNIPPGIFGAEQSNAKFNSYVYNNNNGVITRKPITEAKSYLAQAGYPHGIDQKTGKHLVLYLDSGGSGPNSKSQTNWYRKQLKKIGIDLYVRNTSWNRFQEKLRNGSTQIFTLGWSADYPDPENFLFLLYGPNSKLKSEGENVSNFHNKEYDHLFEKMKNLPNNNERGAIINRMIAISQEQSPWVWGFFHKTFILGHTWNGPNKINPIANNSAKYKSVDAKFRYRKQHEWNIANKNIIGIIFLVLAALILPGIISYRKRTQINQTNKF